MISATRSTECAAIQAAVVRWAESRPDVRAVAVVGSWTRGEPREDSDLDLVVLTDEQHRYTDTDKWIRAALGQAAPVVRRMAWGPVTERRVRLVTGFEVEVGLAPLSWATTDPVDAGTTTVVGDGCVALYDPDEIVADLIAAVAGSG